MSQAGIIDVEGSHPQIPTSFVTNSGTAVPIANTLEILGTIVAPHSIPLETTGSGNTVTIVTQYSSAAASSIATNAGLASFSSAAFSVDANGFVTLNGTGAGETITGNSGGPLSPTAGNWNIFGAATAAGTTPVRTSGTGSTLTVDVQTAQAIASTNATNIGLAAFNSSEFTVDANGFVSLVGGGSAIETITGNTGGPEVPSAGNFNILGTGSITVAGSANTETVQLTGLTAHAVLVGAGTATITKVGPTATAGQVLQSQGSTTDPAFSTATYPSTTTINQILYSSSANTVAGLATANDGVLTTGTTGIPVITALSSNGQLIIGSGSGAPAAATLTAGTGVSITNGANSITIAINGSVVGETITGNSGGALSPTAGNWNIFGAATAAGTTPVTTSGTGSTLTVDVQTSQAIASTNATNIGLAAFNSAQFTVDANGFVSTSGTGVLNTLTPNSGTSPVVPTGGTINVVGVGSITTVGSLNTLTVELTGLTNHAVLVGAGTTTITKVATTATVGQVLQSAGSSADPAYSTATYPLTTTINQILFSSAANTVTGLATANNGVLTTGTTGIPVITPLASNGQLIIGSGSGAPAAATLTAGAGITITNAANSITIAANDSAFAYTNVNHAASPYTVLASDQYISVDTSGGTVSLLFPNAPTANRTWVIKDRTGTSATSNISVTTVGGTVTIDGQTTYTIDSNYASIQLLANSTPKYEVY